MNAVQLLAGIQSIFVLGAEDMARICGLGGAQIPAAHFETLAASNQNTASNHGTSPANQASLTANQASLTANQASLAAADWCSDKHAIQFLNGFIIECRGASDKMPPVEERLTNNLIFRKLKIALGLQADDVLQMLADVDVSLSKHELSALFRKADNKHYRQCSDDLLEAFLASVKLNHYP